MLYGPRILLDSASPSHASPYQTAYMSPALVCRGGSTLPISSPSTAAMFNETLTKSSEVINYVAHLCTMFTVLHA